LSNIKEGIRQVKPEKDTDIRKEINKNK